MIFLEIKRCKLMENGFLITSWSESFMNSDSFEISSK